MVLFPLCALEILDKWIECKCVDSLVGSVSMSVFKSTLYYATEFEVGNIVSPILCFLLDCLGFVVVYGSIWISELFIPIFVKKMSIGHDIKHCINHYFGQHDHFNSIISSHLLTRVFFHFLVLFSFSFIIIYSFTDILHPYIYLWMFQVFFMSFSGTSLKLYRTAAHFLVLSFASCQFLISDGVLADTLGFAIYTTMSSVTAIISCDGFSYVKLAGCPKTA